MNWQDEEEECDLQVAVDRCDDCPFSASVANYDENEPICNHPQANGRSIRYEKARPDWCPLQWQAVTVYLRRPLMPWLPYLARAIEAHAKISVGVEVWR